MKNLLIALGIIAVIGFMAFGWYQSGYNTAVALNQQVKSSWAQVENQLQRRFDLIPNLVNTVKGYTEHEKGLLEDVTRMRSQWAAAPSIPEKVEAANALTGALSKLLMVSENYPDLKANQNFLDLQAQLEGTENRIAEERRNFNDIVKNMNMYVRTFPHNIWAGMFGVQKRAYFESDAGTEKAPQVKF